MLEPARKGIRTAEQLYAAGSGRDELIRGALVVREPCGHRHGELTLEIGGLLTAHVKARDLPMRASVEVGFVLARDPDTVRAPDVALVRADRLPDDDRGFFEGAPDLAVEILSPNDRPGYVRDKVRDWLAAGAHEVWVVDPDARTVRIHRRPGAAALLPGFATDAVFAR